jgi:hypothetical protein
MKIRLGDLKKIIKEEAVLARSASFDTLQRQWLKLSGGLEPDEVDPQDHE